MKTSNLVFALLLCLAGAPLAWAAESEVQTMAQIVLNIRHSASDADKQTLSKIAENSATDAHVRTLAVAIRNIDHLPSDADKQSLRKISEDSAAPQSLRDLAKIVAGFNHKPSSEDQAQLRQLAGMAGGSPSGGSSAPAY